MCGPVPKKRPLTPKLIRRPSAGGSFDSPETSQGGSHLVAVLNNGEVVGEVKPFVPQILTDIMNLESLLCEDDIPSEIGGDRFNMNDPSVFLTFLQLAELKLYKIVRWARNLPYFANISVRSFVYLNIFNGFSFLTAWLHVMNVNFPFVLKTTNISVDSSHRSYLNFTCKIFFYQVLQQIQKSWTKVLYLTYRGSTGKLHQFIQVFCL